MGEEREKGSELLVVVVVQDRGSWKGRKEKLGRERLKGMAAGPTGKVHRGRFGGGTNSEQIRSISTISYFGHLSTRYLSALALAGLSQFRTSPLHQKFQVHIT